MAVGLEEGHVLLLAELARELVDVHGLVVAVAVGILERLLRHEVDDVVVGIDTHHRTVHPRLVLRHEGEVRPWVIDNHTEQAVAEDEVALDEQGVVLLQLVLDDGERVDVVGAVVDGVLGVLDMQPAVVAVADIVDEPLALVAHYDDDAPQLQRGEL